MSKWSSVAAFCLIAATSRAAAAEVSLWVVDGAGAVRRGADARASLQRTPPTPLPKDVTQADGDPDALRYMLVGSIDALPSVVDLSSTDERGQDVASLRSVPLTAMPCPSGVERRASDSCALTEPIRAVSDDIDRRHPLVSSRSIQAVLGGSIAIVSHGATLGALRVAGPRQTPAGPIERLRAKLRFVFVRLSPGGNAPMGGDDAGAREAAREALRRVNGMWGACGISFGGEADVTIVDPPPSHLLSVGCGHGLPASGGVVSVRIGSKTIWARSDRGLHPSEVARRIAAELEKNGFSVTLSDNPRSAAAAGGSTDLSVRDARGELVALLPPLSGPVSTDTTLSACIGTVDLEDGLQHFGDVDAMVGTVEERTLIKAYDDHDPTTIDVILVPGFARGGRIGESFIGADGGSIRNVVVVDRAGIRSNQSSFTLAHELGHVLLDDPGHPDDFGVDLPTRLMDADAADPTAFGPRRLSLEECARALKQSGPGVANELLTPWPLQ